MVEEFIFKADYWMISNRIYYVCMFIAFAANSSSYLLYGLVAEQLQICETL